MSASQPAGYRYVSGGPYLEREVVASPRRSSPRRRSARAPPAGLHFDPQDHAPEDRVDRGALTKQCLGAHARQRDLQFDRYDTVVRGSFHIEGVNYSKYEACRNRPYIADGFADAIRDDIISEVGNGVRRDDVKLRIYPGAIKTVVLHYDEDDDPARSAAAEPPRLVDAEWTMKVDYAIRSRDVMRQQNVAVAIYSAFTSSFGFTDEKTRGAYSASIDRGADVQKIKIVRSQPQQQQPQQIQPQPQPQPALAAPPRPQQMPPPQPQQVQPQPLPLPQPPLEMPQFRTHTSPPPPLRAVPAPPRPEDSVPPPPTSVPYQTAQALGAYASVQAPPLAAYASTQAPASQFQPAQPAPQQSPLAPAAPLSTCTSTYPTQLHPPEVAAPRGTPAASLALAASRRDLHRDASGVFDGSASFLSAPARPVPSSSTGHLHTYAAAESSAAPPLKPLPETAPFDAERDRELARLTEQIHQERVALRKSAPPPVESSWVAPGGAPTKDVAFTGRADSAWASGHTQSGVYEFAGLRGTRPYTETASQARAAAPSDVFADHSTRAPTASHGTLQPSVPYAATASQGTLQPGASAPHAPLSVASHVPMVTAPHVAKAHPSVFESQPLTSYAPTSYATTSHVHPTRSNVLDESAVSLPKVDSTWAAPKDDEAYSHASSLRAADVDSLNNMFVGHNRVTKHF
eukprot:TRINITY_DN7439_c0_g1_i1.p1 TRINITY_DN7439_c0_g1~~TRINITY_DN7439_c0_g1_i1.p1  ORF type:complete len:687 (+),score=167.40 TRINITY_DN7439_c0_g1_i1:57-2117(+)